MMYERNNISHIDASLILLQEVTELSVRTKVEILREKGVKTLIYDLTLDGCTVLNNAYNNKLFKIAFKEVPKFVNKMPTCPIPPVRT